MMILAASSFAQPMAPAGNQQNMDAIRIWKLTESLELTEDQITTFIPIVQLHEREMRELQKEMMTEMRKLHSELDTKETSEKAAAAQLKEFIKLQEQMDSTKLDFIKSLPKYLTPKQQMQYLVFEAEFRRQLRSFLQEQRRGPDTRRGRP
jgi:Spy/CpxP family protein refolding chaperone